MSEETQSKNHREQGSISKSAFQSTRKAKRMSQKAVKTAKKDYRLTKKSSKGLSKKDQTKKISESRVQLKAAKKDLKRHKKAERNKLKAKAKLNANYMAKNKVESSVSDDDVLGGMAKARQNSRQRTQAYRGTKSMVKGVHNVNTKIIKNAYGFTDRSINKLRGRGFNRTPKSLSKPHQMAKKTRRRIQRIKSTKAGQTAKVATKGVKGLIKVINSPLKLKSIGIITGFLLVLGMIFMFVSTSAPGLIQQDEFDLTDSWAYMTKIDADNSDTANIFYTSLDDVMFYMNYNAEDYKMTDPVASLKPAVIGNYKTYFETLWTALNGSSGNYQLTTMSNLAQDDDSAYKMSKDDYEEMSELIDEVRYGALDGQLDFPFETDSLVVTRRYGYEREGDNVTLNQTIEAMVTQGQPINSPMAGTIEINSSDQLTIMDSETAKLIITGINTGRFKGGEVVNSGELLGNSSENKLVFQYEKYDSDTKKWVKVNPAFYFPHVTYTQFTILASDDFNPGQAVEARAQKVYDYLTKLGYTRAGIAAIVGNFDIESSINPKRAEGDYLSPPVGASDSSWDDLNWLNMGGLDIYGKYPNISHRGLGLGQWTDTADGGNRHTLLLNYANSKSKKWYDLELQLDFMLNGDSPGNITYFKNVAGSKVAATVPELTTYFLNYWEGNPGDKLQERIQSAQGWYNYFSSDTSLNGSSKEVYEKYKDKMQPLPTAKETKAGQGWSGNGYVGGNCTWYVYNRMKQLGKTIAPYMGNASQWATNYSQTAGAQLVNDPKRGDIVIFTNGAAGSSALYGHVAVVEYVNSDGTFVISEMNVQGEYSMGWRVLKKQAGEYFMRVN